MSTHPFLAMVTEGIEDLKREIATDDELLADRDAFILKLSEIVGECPIHGPTCMPHIRQAVEDLAQDELDPENRPGHSRAEAIYRPPGAKP